MTGSDHQRWSLLHTGYTTTSFLRHLPKPQAQNPHFAAASLSFVRLKRLSELYFHKLTTRGMGSGFLFIRHSFSTLVQVLSVSSTRRPLPSSPEASLCLHTVLLTDVRGSPCELHGALCSSFDGPGQAGSHADDGLVPINTICRCMMLTRWK